MLCIEIRQRKRTDTPYGDFASVAALAKAAMEKKTVYRCECECGTVFEAEQAFALYCPECNLERKRKAALRTAMRKKERVNGRRAKNTDSDNNNPPNETI